MDTIYQFKIDRDKRKLSWLHLSIYLARVMSMSKKGNFSVLCLWQLKLLPSSYREPLTS